MKLIRLLKNERGSQLIEFVGILPFFMIMIIIIWQCTLTAKAKITTEAAAMEGARMAMVNGDYETAAKNVITSYSGVAVSKKESGEYVTVKVTVNVPLLDNDTFFNTDGLVLPVSSEVTVRKEI